MSFKLVHPFTLTLAGSSGCGKTSFALCLLDRLKELCTVQRFERILWCLDAETPASDIPEELYDLVDAGHNIHLHKGVPSFTNDSRRPRLIVLDDLMNSVYSREVSELFSKHSHHRNLSVILVTQNFFHQSAYSRDISLNTKILVIFKSPRDSSQFTHLARQVRPEDSKSLHTAFIESTLRPHGYLLLDLTQAVNPLLRYRTNIFDREYSVVYTPVAVGERHEAIEVE